MGLKAILDTSEMKGMCYRCRKSTRNILGRPTRTLVHLSPNELFRVLEVV